MSLSTLRYRFLGLIALALLLIASSATDSIALAQPRIQSLSNDATVTIVNEATLKGEGITMAQQGYMPDPDLIAALKAAPFSIINEALLKGDGIAKSQGYTSDPELIADLKAAPFSIINEALLKGDGIYSMQ